MSLRRIAYTSFASKPFSERELIDLLHDARAFNAIDGITGLLIHRTGEFFQIVEGEPTALDDLLDRLQLDSRHHSLTI
ncbi:MAG: BLUF domain-containing protein, partial [Gammaproteobacteria bacterium]